MVSAMEGPEPRALPASSSSPHPPPGNEDSESLRGAVRGLQGEREALQAQLREREYVWPP